MSAPCASRNRNRRLTGHRRAKRIHRELTLHFLHRRLGGAHRALAELKGVDSAMEGKLFRISEVTHVIRIDNHYMDAVLQSDGETPASGGAAGGVLGAAAGALA